MENQTTLLEGIDIIFKTTIDFLLPFLIIIIQIGVAFIIVFLILYTIGWILDVTDKGYKKRVVMLIKKDVLEYQKIKNQIDNQLKDLNDKSIQEVKEFTEDFFLVRKANKLEEESKNLLRIARERNKENFEKLKI